MSALRIVLLLFVTYFALAVHGQFPVDVVLQSFPSSSPQTCDYFIAASEEGKKGIPLVIAAQVWAGNVTAAARRDGGENIKCTTAFRLENDRSNAPNSIPFGVQNVTAKQGEMTHVEMPWKPPLRSWWRMFLNMNGRCVDPMGVELCGFRASRVLKYNSRPSSKEIQLNMPIVLIETDKPVYRPGQTVKGRVVAVNRDLKPIDKKVSLLYILDASGARVVQWTDLNLKTGVAEFSLALSSEPVLGKWEIRAQLSEEREEIVQAISVDKYVLPKFSVDTKLKCASSGRGVCIEVDARYTHGQPVKGKATVNVFMSTYGTQYFVLPDNNVFYVSIPERTFRFEKQAKQVTEICLPFSQVPVTISFRRSAQVSSYKDDRGSTLQRVYDTSGHLPESLRLSVDANFAEDLTGITLAADSIERQSLTDFCKVGPSTIDSPQGKWQLEFTNLWGNHIKPGLPLPLEVTLTGFDGRTAGGHKVLFTCNFTESDAAGGTSLLSTFLRKTIPTKDNGRARLQADVVPCNARRVECTAAISELKLEIRTTFKADFSKTGSHLSLYPTQKSYKAGDSVTAEFCLLLCEDEQLARRQLHYMVVGRRSVLHSGSKTVDQNQLQHHCLTEEQVRQLPPTLSQLATERRLLCRHRCACTSSCGLNITFPALPAMAPAARLIVYTTTSNKNIVLDATEVKVSDPFINKVNIQFDASLTSPGKKTILRMSADPGSLIGVAAVDKSLHLLGESNEVTKERIEKKIDLKGNIPRSSTGQCPGSRKYMSPYHDSRLTDPLMIWWKSTGLTIATTLDFGTRPCAALLPHVPCRLEDQGSGVIPLEIDRDGPAPVGTDTILELPQSTQIPSTSGDLPAPAPVVVKIASKRVFFPETWIFKILELKHNETQKDVIVTVPDTITSWSASAFAISQQSGLGVSDTRQLTVFQPFFLSMKLPYSVIRGEILQLVVSVFNYVQGCTSVTVTVEESSCFVLQPSTSRFQELCLCTDEAKAATFNMTFGELGLCPIVVQAATTGKQPCKREGEVTANIVAVDRVSRKLKVDPDGVEREETMTSLESKRLEDKPFSKQVPLSVPRNIVRGSGRAWLTMSADLMGPSLEGLGNLLRIPSGCGEQNMINFAPGVSIALYLKRTNQLDDLPEVKEKATAVIQQGYQRENRYRHRNGGYSAFGESDYNWGGSTACLWLTSFVVKSFCKAKATGLVHVDEIQVCDSLDWMIQQQNSDGGFTNTNCVTHRALQGGLSSDIGHTAYICSSLLDTAHYGCSCGDIHSTLALAQATNRCVGYLEQRIDRFPSVYQKAIVCYVLRLANSKYAERVCNDMRTNLKRKGESCHLQQSEDIPSRPCNLLDWRCRMPSRRSSDVEMTAYSLLGDLLGKGQPTGCLERWLAEQRNSFGGYSSTQDTVVALDALSEAAHHDYSGKNLVFRGKYFYIPRPYRPRLITTGAFYFDKTNRMVVQKQELRPLPGTVYFIIQGEGSALFQISTRYNVRESVPEPAFYLSADVVKSEEKAATVRVCTRWTHGQSDTSNMALITFEMPSGYVADEEILSLLKSDSTVKLERFDVDGKNVFLYFFEIGRTQVCFELDIHLDVIIGNLQPSTVRIQDYYQPDLEATAEYRLSSVNKCPVNETFSECEANCSTSCPEVVSGITPTCAKTCVPGCRCKKDFAKVADRCILETECASVLRPCGANQVFKDCVTPCPARCQRGVANPATQQCVCEGQNPGCECVEGYVLDSNGQCMLPTDCDFDDM